MALCCTMTYENAWRQLRRVRRLTAYSVIFLSGWLLLQLIVDPQFELTHELVLTFLPAVAFWSFAILRYLHWRCPNCGMAFQSGFIGGPWTLWPRKRCIHCGIEIGS